MVRTLLTVPSNCCPDAQQHWDAAPASNAQFIKDQTDL